MPALEGQHRCQRLSVADLGSAPPVSGQAAQAPRCSHRSATQTQLAASGRPPGTAAGVVGSLRGDCTRQSLPMWELSVMLGRGRGDMNPAWSGLRYGPVGRGGAWDVAREEAPAGPVSWAYRSDGWVVVSRSVGRQRGAHTAEHAGLELPHHLPIYQPRGAPRASASAAPPARPRAGSPADQAGPAGRRTGRRARCRVSGNACAFRLR